MATTNSNEIVSIPYESTTPPEGSDDKATTAATTPTHPRRGASSNWMTANEGFRFPDPEAAHARGHTASVHTINMNDLEAGRVTALPKYEQPQVQTELRLGNGKTCQHFQEMKPKDCNVCAHACALRNNVLLLGRTKQDNGGNYLDANYVKAPDYYKPHRVHAWMIISLVGVIFFSFFIPFAAAFEHLKLADPTVKLPAWLIWGWETLLFTSVYMLGAWSGVYMRIYIGGGSDMLKAIKPNDNLPMKKIISHAWGKVAFFCAICMTIGAVVFGGIMMGVYLAYSHGRTD